MASSPLHRLAAAIGRVAALPLRGLISFLILFDELARPLYRPAIRWLSERRFVARAEAAIARMPRFAILALLAAPFAVVEPLKLVSLIVIARGHVISGLIMLGLAYLASFVIVERIYNAGRKKLLTISWFARGMAVITDLRARTLDWVRRSPIHAFMLRTRDAVRSWWRARRI
ncbi:hypothetical protein AB4Z40_24040 [Bosea sp. 2YAB26]|uniref:hypothetical protein n=1 Tax=Bosea sp. 2YAB26 TaxID=3237478 RepID=UPI003F8EF28E